MEQREIDPLQEAGFIPRDAGEVETEADEVMLRPAGRVTGSLGWTSPSARLPSGPEPAIPGAVGPEALADDFCRRDGAVVSVREVDPGRVGMSGDSLALLDEFILAALEDSAASGAALAIVRRGQLVRLRGFGSLDWDPAAPPVTPSSIFDLASLTKVVGTTSAVMTLAQRGVLGLDDPVTDYLPWWSSGDSRKSTVTIRHLLLHQGGLPPFRRFFLEMEGRGAFEGAIGALELEYAARRQGTVYSDIGLMTAGFVVEEVTGRPLDELPGGRVSSSLWGCGTRASTPIPSESGTAS